MKQPDANGGFQLLDPRRHIRRDTVQPARRFDDASLFDDRLEDLQIAEVHSCSLNSNILFSNIHFS
jgi:hypothetical protein